MRSFLSSVAVVLVCATAVALEPDWRIAALVKTCEAARPQAITEAREAVELAKQELARARMAKGRDKAGKVASAERSIKVAREYLTALERGDELPIPRLPDKLAVGIIGHRGNAAGKVELVLGPHDCVIRWPEIGLVWLSKVSTDNLPADRTVSLPSILYVDRLVEYDTERWGRRTLLVLEAVDEETLRQAWKERRR